jgi:ribonuclease kappa
MPVCGTHLSTFGVVLSLWGAVQLGLTGILLHVHSVAFIEDIPAVKAVSASELASGLDVGFQQAALNCWIAALLYVATLCFSVQQFWMNTRVKEIESEMF